MAIVFISYLHMIPICDQNIMIIYSVAPEILVSPPRILLIYLNKRQRQLAVLYMSSLFLEICGIIVSQITIQQNQFLSVKNDI